MSAIPGQKQKAYAQVLPQKVTKLAAAWRKDIFSITNDICERRFCVKMFRTLWYTDSARKSEELDAFEDVVDVEDVSTRSASAQKGEGDSLHSGRSIMPAIASRIAGRSVPEID
jgi:hypothetical protein